MTVSVLDLQEAARDAIRAVVQRGEEIILTDAGTPVARIVPYVRTSTVSPELARQSGVLTDESIIAALRETREDSVQQFDPQ